jgi:maleamate amidohydrolase
MHPWDDVISERDRQVMDAAGYGQNQNLGRRPALLVIDVNYGFVGRQPLPILEAIRRTRTSCGEAGWEAVKSIRILLDASRLALVPVIYSTGRSVTAGGALGRWSSKNRRTGEDAYDPKAREIVAEIAPLPGDLVIEKGKPSVFFGTELLSHLVDSGIDTLLVMGGTTSGCVRATVVDAFSYNLRVAVVEEGTFDRSEISHKVSLFDMAGKYANVWSLAEALEYLEGLDVSY